MLCLYITHVHLEISKHLNVKRVRQSYLGYLSYKQFLPSLVCQAHADIVISKRSDLKFKKFTEPIPLSVADARSKLSAVVTIQVPILYGTEEKNLFLQCL